MTQEEKGKWMNKLVGDELIAHLQYTIAAHVVVGTDYDSSKAEFEQHAADELEHMNTLLEKMIQEHLPVDQDLISLIKNSYSGYVDMKGQSSKDLLLFHHQAEINAIKSYKAFLKALGNEDYGLKQKLRSILNDELEHRTDLEKVLSSVQNTKTLIPTEESALFSCKSNSKAFSSLDRLLNFAGENLMGMDFRTSSSSSAPLAPQTMVEQRPNRANMKFHEETYKEPTVSAQQQAVEENLQRDAAHREERDYNGRLFKRNIERLQARHDADVEEEKLKRNQEKMIKLGVDPNMTSKSPLYDKRSKHGSAYEGRNFYNPWNDIFGLM